ncbi:MAG: hypothetical protein SGPRY_008345 [Prymnesium sp.]
MGESALYVHKGIEDMLQTEVKYFSMVRRDGERMYICLGKRALYLIDFEPPFQDKYYFAWVQRVILDKDNVLLFQKIELRGYLMFIDDSFIAGPQGPDGLPTGHFTSSLSDERKLTVAIHPAYSVAQLGRREKDNRAPLFRLAAERMARQQTLEGGAAEEMIILRSEQYHKRMNLMGDLACYGCWAVHLRTASLDIGVVACRRKFFPPIGDQYQLQSPDPSLHISCGLGKEDLFVVMSDSADSNDDPLTFITALERQADTISPVVRVPFYDDTIARVKADALLPPGIPLYRQLLMPILLRATETMPFLSFDEDSFSWFHSEGIMSVNVDAARAFYKSIAHLLVREEMPDLPFNIDEVEPDTVLIEDPFRIIGTLWEDAPGLKEDSANEAWRNWRRRVARYLYWAIDGGLHPGEITLDLLIKCEKRPATKQLTKDILQRLFDFFVHYELESSALGDKISDPEFVEAFSMNMRPLLVLLERGFIQRTLEDEQPPKYIPFLAMMLKRNVKETGNELLVVVCTQIALMSQIEMNREKLLHAEVLNPLIELLNSEDDALINLSSGNMAAKSTIVNEGGVRLLVPHLLNKTEELTRAFCVLLKNCLTAPELRERVVNDGAVPVLIKLIKKSAIQDAHRSDSVVGAAAAAIWNLSAQEGVKNVLLRNQGIHALVMQIRESQSPEVWQKCAGCLMVLAANSASIKSTVGEVGGIEVLVDIVKRESHNKTVVKAALGALAVLSSDQDNLVKLRNEPLDLDMFRNEKDERLLMFVQQLLDRLWHEK